MNCPKCNTLNDEDSRFCSECGEPANSSPLEKTRKSKKVYLYTLFLLPVLAAAIAIGYYKYMLPGGTAAIVNGEEITVSELDRAVSEITGSSASADPRLRYQVLNGLITERIVLQQARKAGLSVSRAELTASVDEARRSSGISEADFEREAALRYGSMRTFEKVLARRLLANKFVTEKVMPRNADARTAGLAVNGWLQELSGRADVRITLAEQLSGAGGCACCNKPSGSPGTAGGPGLVPNAEASSSGPAPASPAEVSAAQAAVKYWQEKYKDQKVTTSVRNFGCHMEVDIVKDGKTVGSLRYQRGMISEL